MAAWKADKRPFWWSHMTAVIQEYRNRNVGLALKFRQREEALAAGIDLIEWTFDPLQAMNAHFNVSKLGVVVRDYEENVYGMTSSPLHSGLPTDRFVAEWRLNSDRVKQRIDSEEGAVIIRDIDRLQSVNANLALVDSPLLLEIPVDLAAIKSSDVAAAREWQRQVRDACLHYFSRGFSVTDFIRVDEPQPQAFYVLERELDSVPEARLL
jgi:predicted GNAT superfamily acetyltransferase